MSQFNIFAFLKEVQATATTKKEKAALANNGIAKVNDNAFIANLLTLNGKKSVMITDNAGVSHVLEVGEIADLPYSKALINVNEEGAVVSVEQVRVADGNSTSKTPGEPNRSQVERSY